MWVSAYFTVSQLVTEGLMNRKEFEAVLAMEGLILELKRRKCYHTHSYMDRRPWYAGVSYKGAPVCTYWAWKRNRKTALQRVIRKFIAGKANVI